MMLVNPNTISPSQDYLKENTVKFIFECIENGDEDKLPPPPIIRRDHEGQFVAIDGHNLLAVMAYLGRDSEVHVASNAKDGLSDDNEANKVRNQDLFNKFESCLIERDIVYAQGLSSFSKLIKLYPEIFR